MAKRNRKELNPLLAAGPIRSLISQITAFGESGLSAHAQCSVKEAVTLLRLAIVKLERAKCEQAGALASRP